jgi:hypothetical protein
MDWLDASGHAHLRPITGMRAPVVVCRRDLRYDYENPTCSGASHPLKKTVDLSHREEHTD